MEEVLSAIKNWFAGIPDWLIGFFSFHDILKMIHTGDYSALRSFKGLIGLLGPVFPVLLAIELAWGLILRKFQALDYKLSFWSFVFNSFIGKFISIGAIGWIIGWLEPVALFHVSFTWYWFIYGYIIWELGHFFYHYFGHKVRLFWCLYSTHHAAETMNLSISFAHFFLEGPYADVIRTTTCLAFGVPPPMLFIIMTIDGCWGGIIHLGENMAKDARMGWLGKFILTPSHHRVHHGRNPVYMDTNFCNLLNIWDHVFKTYQPELHEVPVEYGISRPIKNSNWLDAYFGEFAALGRDVYHAPGLKNKLLYFVMPPGWSHTGHHKTAVRARQEHFEKLRHEKESKASEGAIEESRTSTAGAMA